MFWPFPTTLWLKSSSFELGMLSFLTAQSQGKWIDCRNKVWVTSNWFIHPLFHKKNKKTNLNCHKVVQGKYCILLPKNILNKENLFTFSPIVSINLIYMFLFIYFILFLKINRKTYLLHFRYSQHSIVAKQDFQLVVKYHAFEMSLDKSWYVNGSEFW